MFTFFIENHEFFGPLTNNCPKLDKNKSIVSSFLVFVVYKSAVSIVQNKNKQLCRMFQFSSVNICFAHLSLDISIKSAKLHFVAGKKFLKRFFFFKMTADVSRNNCASGIRIENFLDIF